MHIFVTGGAGYIGSICSEELINAGHQVTIFDNLTEGHRAALDAARHVHQGRPRQPGRNHQGRGRRQAGRHHALRRQRAGGRVDDQSLEIFPQQRRRRRQPARCRGRRRREEVHLLLHLRHLRHAGENPDGRAPAAKADQSLRRIEAHVRADPQLVRQDSRPRVT